jgi:hypothetical protein
LEVILNQRQNFGTVREKLDSFWGVGAGRHFEPTDSPQGLKPISFFERLRPD